ncbi:MAG: SLC45 family MFS transporter [Bacteroidales bacterium]|nr:SLC45 family MFS transporter [Bacteroidales bacterium]
MTKKPKLSFWQIWNLSFGFLGVQFGFALQNANVSRILSNLGADPNNLSLFWLAAPIMGLIVQPIVGGASDHTWNRLGRRFPYILGGAIISVLAMFFMPNSAIVTAIMPPLVFGAIMMALMDGSFNVTFQPFRSLVSDMLPEEQKNVGYSIQSFLINVGSVLGSVLPYILTNWFGVNNTAAEGHVPDSVIWSFYIGGAVLMLTVLVTIFTTKEYTPEQMKEFATENNEEKSQSENKSEGLISLIKNAPKIMWQLAVVQFFAWFALYLMWTYTTSAVAQHYWGTEISDTKSEAFNEAGNWVGIIFGAYGVFAALFALCMPKLIKLFSRKIVYAAALACGGLGFISMIIFTDPNMLIISMIGIGIAWAAILALPFAILSSSLPQEKTGVYLGIFNFTVSVPQIVSGLVGGVILKYAFNSQSIKILVLCGVSMILGSIFALTLKDKQNQESEKSK